MEELEQQIAQLTAERTDIEAALRDGATSATLLTRYADLSGKMESLEARWLVVGEALEAALSDIAGEI
jgi:hypothetical protein